VCLLTGSERPGSRRAMLACVIDEKRTRMNLSPRKMLMHNSTTSWRCRSGEGSAACRLSEKLGEKPSETATRVRFVKSPLSKLFRCPTKYKYSLRSQETFSNPVRLFNEPPVGSPMASESLRRAGRNRPFFPSISFPPAVTTWPWKPRHRSHSAVHTDPAPT